MTLLNLFCELFSTLATRSLNWLLSSFTPLTFSSLFNKSSANFAPLLPATFSAVTEIAPFIKLLAVLLILALKASSGKS